MVAICKPDFDRRVKANKDAEKALEKAKQEKKSTKEIIVPAIGFHEVYGVWFFGQIKNVIMKIGVELFETNLDKTMHVFLDIEEKKLTDGVHDVMVYGNTCRLYKWVAQGYHRGLVVLDVDEDGNKHAEAYRQSGTWSWIL